jgi:hypothetical protein
VTSVCATGNRLVESCAEADRSVVIRRAADVTCAPTHSNWDIDGEDRVTHVAFPARLAPSASKQVRLRDRLLDVVAALCIIGGATMFLLARRTLTAIAAGEIKLPLGPVSNVAFADSVVLRSRIGIWLVVVGALLAVASAISHRFRKGA